MQSESKYHKHIFLVKYPNSNANCAYHRKLENKKAEEQEDEAFESTEQRAINDMNECEKLLGFNEYKSQTHEERWKRLENEKQEIQKLTQEREREEAKRISKKFKKNIKDADLVFFDKRTSDDKKLKTMFDYVMRAIKEQEVTKQDQLDQNAKVEKYKTEIEAKSKGLDKTIQTKTMLYNLFQSLKEKNIEAYRTKDEAIKEQQEAKKKMTQYFEKEIDSVTVNYQKQLDIKSDYEKKKTELEKLAQEYKKLESQSKAMLEQKENRIVTLQQQINEKIDKELKVLMDKFNAEKSKYDKFIVERDQINNQYKDLKEKFQRYLADIESSDSKIKTYEAEIQALQLRLKGSNKEFSEMKEQEDSTLQKSNSLDEEISSISKKIEIFNNLKADLLSKVEASKAQ